MSDQSAMVRYKARDMTDESAVISNESALIGLQTAIIS